MRQILEYHPVIGYRFVPKIKARLPHEAGGYLVRTNNWGFRSEYDFFKAKGDKFRILLFGDSYTAGDGVSNGKRYSDFLEKELDDVEVYNFGLPGTGTDQQYLTFLEYGKDIEFDLLVIGLQVENIRRIVVQNRVYQNENGESVVYEKPYFSLHQGELKLNNVPPKKEGIPLSAFSKSSNSEMDRGGRFQLLRKMINRLGLRDLVQKLTGYNPLPEYDSKENEAWKLMAALIKKWTKAQEKPVVVMTIPLYQHVEETSSAVSYQERFKELNQGGQFILYDPLDDFLSFSKKERMKFRFGKDVHFTEEGHQVIAHSLAKVVKKLKEERKVLSH
ncbi:SGNH/GDSL hydrolase family protein [Candidatus Auribacterota bacterium]